VGRAQSGALNTKQTELGRPLPIDQQSARMRRIEGVYEAARVHFACRRRCSCSFAIHGARAKRIRLEVRREEANIVLASIGKLSASD